MLTNSFFSVNMGNSQSYDLVQNDPKNREKTRKSLDETLPSSPCKTVSIHNTSSLRRPKRKREKNNKEENQENISVNVESSGRESAIDISPSELSPASYLSSHPSEAESEIYTIHKSKELDSSPLETPAREYARSPCTDLRHDESTTAEVASLQATSPQLSPSTKPDQFEHSPKSGYHPYDVVPVELETLGRVQELENTPMIIQSVSTSTLEIIIGPESKPSEDYPHGMEVIVPVQSTPESTVITPVLTDSPSTSQDYPPLITNIEVSPPEPLFRVPELPKEDLIIVKEIEKEEEQQVVEVMITDAFDEALSESIIPSSSESVPEVELLQKQNELEKNPIMNHPIMENMDEASKRGKEIKKRSRTASSEVHPVPFNHKQAIHTSALERDQSDDVLDSNVNVVVLQKLHRQIPLPTIELDALPSQSTYHKLPVH